METNPIAYPSLANSHTKFPHEILSGRKTAIPFQNPTAFMDLAVHATARMIREEPTRQRPGVSSPDTPGWGHFPTSYERTRNPTGIGQIN